MPALSRLLSFPRSPPEIPSHATEPLRDALGMSGPLEGKCIVVTIEEGRDVLRMGACLPVPEQQWTLKEIAP